MKKLLNFKNACIILAAALPFYLVKISFGFFSTNLWEAMFGACFILFLLQASPWPAWKKLIRDYPLIFLAASLILIGFLLSSFWSLHFWHSLAIVKSWLLVPVAFMFMARVACGAGGINRLYGAYQISAAAVGLIALGYLAAGELTFDGRLQAFFNSPNYLAMFLVPALLMALIQTQKGNSSYLILASLAIPLYFTYSYAAWLAAAVSFSLIGFLVWRPEMKKALVVCLIMAGTALMFQSGSPKFDGLFESFQQTSFASRVVIWKAAGKILADHWLLGIGPDNFQPVYLAYQVYFPPYPEWAVPHPHNIFLAFWLYGGLLGLIGFFVLVYAYLKAIAQRIKKAGSDPALRNAELISLAIVLCALIQGFFDTSYFKNDLSVVFWLSFLVL